MLPRGQGEVGPGLDSGRWRFRFLLLLTSPSNLTTFFSFFNLNFTYRYSFWTEMKTMALQPPHPNLTLHCFRGSLLLWESVPSVAFWPLTSLPSEDSERS